MGTLKDIAQLSLLRIIFFIFYAIEAISDILRLRRTGH